MLDFAYNNPTEMFSKLDALNVTLSNALKTDIHCDYLETFFKSRNNHGIMLNSL